MTRVLLVEDDVWMADCYRLWLGQAGHEVSWARDAQEALDLADEQPPDVIVLDLFLPFANGIQLLHTLRSHVDLAAIPVILCSSQLPEQLPDLQAYGVHAALDKASLRPDSLRAAVHEVSGYAPV